jgi:hypothetical protein
MQKVREVERNNEEREEVRRKKNERHLNEKK